MIMYDTPNDDKGFSPQYSSTDTTNCTDNDKYNKVTKLELIEKIKVRHRPSLDTSIDINLLLIENENNEN
jgi:hypothetical protein